MLTYTNQRRELVLPQYGRNIQGMVDHCMTIEDRAERTLCAETIIETMMKLFPAPGSADDYRRKLWDHVYIMSDFKLDVDCPYELVQPEVFDQGPEPVPAERTGGLAFRHYGRYIQDLISIASDMEAGDERTALITLIANQMKKTLMAENTEGADDLRIFKDLHHMSRGAIHVDASEIRVLEYHQAPTPSGKKKRKK